MTSEHSTNEEHATIHADDKTGQHSSEAKQSVAPALTKPEPQPSHYKDDIACNKKRDWIDKLTLGLEGFGLFVLIIYTIFTGMMYCANKKAADAAEHSAREAKNANEATRDALEKVQRAFVAPGTPTITSMSGGDALWFSFRWENSGTTPTRGFQTHDNYQAFTGPMPEDFTFPDLWEPGRPHTNIKTVIGPKAYLAIDLGPIPTNITDAVAKHKKHLYFWGWAKYRDVFDRTPDHVTMFCLELVPKIIKSAGSTGVSWGFDSCQRHNCADEECAIEP